jgi:hypothetical protein
MSAARDPRDVLGLALRVERDAHLQSVLARGGDRRRDVVDGLVVKRDAVAARRRDRFEVLRRPFDHQVQVDGAAAAVDQRGDRLEHDRAHRDRLDEVSVADVEVKHPAARLHQRLDLCAEVREVGSVERRLDLGGANPAAPGHARDPTVRAIAR